MLIDHLCMDCGFLGEAIVRERQVECPICHVINDVWLEGENQPLRHQIMVDGDSFIKLAETLRRLHSGGIGERLV